LGLSQAIRAILNHFGVILGPFLDILINFLAIWDLVFICHIVIQTLALTLAFNELFDRNAEHLEALREHINIASAQLRAKIKHTCDRTESSLGRPLSFSSPGKPENESYSQCKSCSMKLECQDAEEYIQSLIRGIKSFDLPATMFGLTLNKNTLGTLGSLAGTLLASQALVVFQSSAGVFSATGQENGYSKIDS